MIYEITSSPKGSMTTLLHFVEDSDNRTWLPYEKPTRLKNRNQLSCVIFGDSYHEKLKINQK